MNFKTDDGDDITDWAALEKESQDPVIDAIIERLEDRLDEIQRRVARRAVNEIGWLIEISIGGRAVWWRAIAECGRTWTADSTEAVRFARKADAERVIRGLTNVDPVMPGAIATEHMWCAP